MKTYFSHIVKTSDYNPTVDIEYFGQADLRCQGGVVLFFGFN